MTYVVSEGALQAVSRPSAPAPYRLKLSDDYSEDYAAIWRTQPAVRTVVSFLARNVAQLGLHAFERVSDDERRRLSDHPLPRLIARPNPFTTRYRLFNDLVHDLGIFDAGYWLKAGTPAEPGLLRLPPPITKPVGDSWMFASGFEVKGGSGKVTYPADRVVHFHGYNPDDARTGCSPIESLRRVLAEEWQAGKMREQVLRNGARHSGYIKRPQGEGRRGNDWSPEARARFKADWQAQYTGDGPQAGGTPVLEDGMEFVAASQTAQQLEYVAARKLTREEVAAAYFIPPPMVGILDHATFGNIEEQHKMLYADTLGPWLVMMQEEMGLQLLPWVASTDRVYVEFNLAEKLRGSFEQQAAVLSTATGAPYLTRNEARSRQNLPPVEGGDVLIVPLNVLEGGLASPRDTAPPPQVEGAASRRALPAGKARGPRSAKARPPATYVTKAEQVMASFFRRQRSAILSRLGAKAAADVWDDERWDGELSDDLYALATTVSAYVGGKTLEALGFDADEYDTDRTLRFLRAVADRIAGQVNATTKAQVLAALDADEDPVAAVGHVFDVAEEARASSSARSTVSTVAGFASVEAGKQQAGEQATKTWVVTSGNPRPSHASMDGETVPIGDTFSNGAMWPADASLDVDEIAGCECDVIVNVPG